MGSIDPSLEMGEFDKIGEGKVVVEELVGVVEEDEEDVEDVEDGIEDVGRVGQEDVAENVSLFGVVVVSCVVDVSCFVDVVDGNIDVDVDVVGGNVDDDVVGGNVVVATVVVATVVVVVVVVSTSEYVNFSCAQRTKTLKLLPSGLRVLNAISTSMSPPT